MRNIIQNTFTEEIKANNQFIQQQYQSVELQNDQLQQQPILDVDDVDNEQQARMEMGVEQLQMQDNQ